MKTKRKWLSRLGLVMLCAIFTLSGMHVENWRLLHNVHYDTSCHIDATVEGARLTAKGFETRILDVRFDDGTGHAYLVYHANGSIFLWDRYNGSLRLPITIAEMSQILSTVEHLSGRVVQAAWDDDFERTMVCKNAPIKKQKLVIPSDNGNEPIVLEIDIPTALPPKK